jgi:methylenetetrahydrofolate--tRNA-(uracil-5-)-methyltransferase
MLFVVTVIGGGLAGCEAAWAAAQRGSKVRLYEMRPNKTTPAHQSGDFAELVCSNSLKTTQPDSPGGLLKAEMVALGSLVIPVAEETAVPGGQALAVDREQFARAITQRISKHPNIVVVREEANGRTIEQAINNGPVVIATGPLTSDAVATWLAERTEQDQLFFYDAVSPIVEASSIDRSIVFAQSRYDKGEGDDYLNSPFDKEQYLAFVQALVSAERAPLHEFEESERAKIPYFAGCTPIEAIAEKGERSLAFGNFKPIGLTDPRTGRRPYAALQLRPENREKTLYSLVACQNRLKWGDQQRVFSMVPGLEHAEFVRMGVIHRNTYVKSPEVLDGNLQLNSALGVFLAGQITGVEGYVESAAMGILAGMQAACKDSGQRMTMPPRESALGSLLAHLQDTTERDFAPMNINWGILPEPEPPIKDKGVRRTTRLNKAREAFNAWLADPNR